MEEETPEYKTIKVKWPRGYLSGNGGTDWWTQEDWDKHNAYVEELKAAGTYGKIDEVEIRFQTLPEFEEKYSLGKCGILMPKGDSGLEPPKFGLKNNC